MLHQSFIAVAVLTILLLPAVAHAAPPPPRMIMTWVPPYAIEKCRARLEENFDNVGPKDGLTHLALQFWVPTRSGGVEKTPKFGEISDATILHFRDWAHAHRIRVMLCVYNGVDSWDWSLAQAGFADHREKFVGGLVAEMQRLDLDGIDVDLEGNGQFESSKGAFVDFVRELSGKLRALGKQLTVDSFSYQWNAPNQNWWPELFPLVDGLNTMGYDEIGVNAEDWRAYAAQKAAAGANASKLMIGFPGDKTDWHGHTVAEHLAWIVRDPEVGVAIWDAQFGAPYWRASVPWKALAGMSGR